MSLYHISDASGELEITQVSTKPLLQKMLDSQDAFLVDSGAGAVYAWIGKESTKGMCVDTLAVHWNVVPTPIPESLIYKAIYRRAQSCNALCR